MSRLHPIELNSYTPLRELVFESISQAIVNGVLEPGERLMEVQLAEELGVSRTPVREAIRQLELSGFVVMIPRKGAYVADLSLREVAEVFEIRGALEALAASLAAERASDEEIEQMERLLVELGRSVGSRDIAALVDLDTRFHDAIYHASRNERLGHMLSSLREQIQRFRGQTLAHPGRMVVALEEHRAIVEAIAVRDAETAAALAAQHIESAEGCLMQLNFEERQAKTKAKTGQPRAAGRNDAPA